VSHSYFLFIFESTKNGLSIWTNDKEVAIHGYIHTCIYTYCHVPAFGSSRDTHLSSLRGLRKLTCLAVDIDGQLQKERHGDSRTTYSVEHLSFWREAIFYFVYKTMWTLRSLGLGTDIFTQADVPCVSSSAFYLYNILRNITKVCCSCELGPLGSRPKRTSNVSYVTIYAYTLYPHTYIHACVHIYIHIHTCIQTCIYTYIHTYIHTYMHIYIHAYIL